MRRNSQEEIFIRAAIVILGLASASGCQTISNGHTATPVETGSVEVAAAGGGSAPRSFPTHVPGGTRGIYPEGRIRIGLNEHLGVGVRGGSRSLGGDVNVAPVVGPDFALSINPELLFQRYEIEGACTGFGWMATCPSYTHNVAKGGAAVLADLFKSEHVVLTAGGQGGMWWDRYESSSWNSDELTRRDIPHVSRTPYAGARAGAEAAHGGAFLRAHYENRVFVEENPHWRDPVYHTVAVSTGYRFF